MSIKEQIKNEHILWMGKQDMKAAVLRAFINPLLIFVAAWLALSYQNIIPALANPNNYTNAGLAIGMALGYLIPVWVYLFNAVSYILTARSSEYAITDNAVYIQKGVLSFKTHNENLCGYSYNMNQSAVGKLTGTSDIKMTFQSGSIYYTNGYRHVHTIDFSNLADAEKVLKILQSHILSFDLSEYHLSKDTKRLANWKFMEEKTDRNGHYMLAGYWKDNYCYGFAEKCALDLVMVNCYQAYAYSDEQMVVFDYCEGDVTLKPFTDWRAYEKEKAETIAFYRKARRAEKKETSAEPGLTTAADEN